METGLVSVTFRQLCPEAIIALCVECHLDAIEWGGDIHVPAGDLATAGRVARLTQEAGLRIAAYGSYYKLGDTAAATDNGSTVAFESVLETALALEAPVIRVWAGRCASQDSTPDTRLRVCEDAHRCAELAARQGVCLASECHSGTLTDTTESHLNFLQTVNHPAMRTLWQPPVGSTIEDNIKALRLLSPWLEHLHVFHWESDYQHRKPLYDGLDKWRTYAQAIHAMGKSCPFLLEFLPADDPALLPTEADTLRKIINFEIAPYPET